MKAWNGLAFARAEYESCRAQAAHDRALMSSALFRRLSNGFNISIPRFRSPYLAASSMALERPAKRNSASLAAALASIWLIFPASPTTMCRRQRLRSEESRGGQECERNVRCGGER